MKKLILIILCVMPLLTQAATVITATGAQTWSGPITFTAPEPPPPDTNAPTILSVTIAADGTNITVMFSESVSAGAGGTVGWSNTLGAMTYASKPTATTAVYQADSLIYSTNSGTATYTQPGNGWEDTSGNDCGSTNIALVNNSTNIPAYIFSDDFEDITSSWTQIADENFSETATWGAILETQSMSVTNTEGLYRYAHVTLQSNNTYNGFFAFVYYQVVGTVYPMTLSRVGIANDMSIEVGVTNEFIMRNGYASGTNATVLTAGTTNFVWWEWSKSDVGSSNGVYKLWLSADQTKPGTPNIDKSDGTCANQPTSILTQAHNATFILDKVRVATTTTIGSNPE